jgi:Glycine rich protein
MSKLLVSVGSSLVPSSRPKPRPSRLRAPHRRFTAAIGLALASAFGSLAHAGPVTFNFDQNTVQTYTIPTTGTYSLTAFGAQGGLTFVATGGGGAEVSGTIMFTAGTVLDIVVGGEGGSGFAVNANGAGGGGGSFVYLQNNETLPLLVAGGGGGGSTASPTFAPASKLRLFSRAALIFQSLCDCDWCQLQVLIGCMISWK